MLAFAFLYSVFKMSLENNGIVPFVLSLLCSMENDKVFSGPEFTILEHFSTAMFFRLEWLNQSLFICYFLAKVSFIILY